MVEKAQTPKPPFEYMSIMRTRIPGATYESAGDFLAEHGSGGWELVTVCLGQRWYTNELFEIFYFKRPI